MFLCHLGTLCFSHLRLLLSVWVWCTEWKRTSWCIQVHLINRQPQYAKHLGQKLQTKMRQLPTMIFYNEVSQSSVAVGMRLNRQSFSRIAYSSFENNSLKCSTDFRLYLRLIGVIVIRPSWFQTIQAFLVWLCLISLVAFCIYGS